MADNWCKPVITDLGVTVSGGAARNVRIAKRGGMDKICREAGEVGARIALQMADLAVQPSNDPKVTPIKDRKKK